MNETIPKSIAQSEIVLFGVTLHLHVLDNGQRIIDSDDMATLFEAMGKNGDSSESSSATMEVLARFYRGASH